MTTNIKDRLALLKRLAEQHGISWQDSISQIPEGDDIALIGLVADRLGVPITVALDDNADSDDLAVYITLGGNDG